MSVRDLPRHRNPTLRCGIHETLKLCRPWRRCEPDTAGCDRLTDPFPDTGNTHYYGLAWQQRFADVVFVTPAERPHPRQRCYWWRTLNYVPGRRHKYHTHMAHIRYMVWVPFPAEKQLPK